MKSASLKCVVLCVMLALAGIGSAATWTGGGNDPYWDNWMNWSNYLEPVAGDIVTVNTVIAGDGITLKYPVIDKIVNGQCLDLNVGNAGSGALDMTGGTLTIGQYFRLAVNAANSKGVFNLSGGDVIFTTKELEIGRFGTGILNMTGGSITVTLAGRDFFITSQDTGSGLLNMDGGTITTPDDFYLGWTNAPGRLRMAGGQINIGDLLNCQSSSKAELFGGTISMTNLSMAASVSIDISGGQLVVANGGALQGLIDAGRITSWGGLGTVNVGVVDGKSVVSGTADAAVMAKAWQPSPANKETIFVDYATLTWIAGKGADSQKVYLGKDPNALALLTSDPNQGVLSVDFHTTVTGLDFGTTYFWRVDEVNTVDARVTTGDVWSFDTYPPELAQIVYPLSGATGIETTGLQLQWKPGVGAINHDVYFGTDAANLALVSENQTATTYPVPGTLILGQTYYWRIDEFDGNEVYTGLVTSFQTTQPAAIATWTNLTNPSDSRWNNPANWNGGLPGVGTTARLRNTNSIYVVVDADTNAFCSGLEFGWNAGDIADLRITGGSLTVLNYIECCRNAGSMATLRMSGGVLNMGNFRGWHGDMWIEMTGGEMNVAGTLEIPRSYTTTVGAAGVFKLLGGVARVGTLTLNGNANIVCKVDITQGTLILDGDKTVLINGYIAAGLITGYDGAGSLSVNYNVTNPGKTTVIACSQVFQADFNGDCVVNELDRALLMSDWGYKTPSEIVWDFNMSTDPVGPDPFDLKVRSVGNGNYAMGMMVPGTLEVQGPLLLDEQLSTSGLWDAELHYVARAMSGTEAPLRLWVTQGSSASPASQAYVGVSLFLDSGTNTQTCEIWTGNPPTGTYAPLAIPGFAANAMVDVTIYYHYNTDTLDWTATDGTLAQSGTAVPYVAYNAGNGGNFTIQGIDGTNALIDQLTFKIHGSDMSSTYDINKDGVVDQLDLDILESEMTK